MNEFCTVYFRTAYLLYRVIVLLFILPVVIVLLFILPVVIVLLFQYPPRTDSFTVYPPRSDSFAVYPPRSDSFTVYPPRTARVCGGRVCPVSSQPNLSTWFARTLLPCHYSNPIDGWWTLQVKM